jgi:1,2-phenylacetyl-CoA epoxidase catalytic subunit
LAKETGQQIRTDNRFSSGDTPRLSTTANRARTLETLPMTQSVMIHENRSAIPPIDAPAIEAGQPLTDASRAVFADILSQAISGELVGMANYAAMARMHPDIAGQCDAVRHAAIELRHAERFRRAAHELGVVPIEDPAAPYWARVRAAFLCRVAAGDLLGCLMIQEVMLEAVAVAVYGVVAEVARGELARVFRATADEEQAHIDHAIDFLREGLAADREGFEIRLERLHDEVMTVLAEMLAARDSVAHCGLCRGRCMKQSLPSIGLDRAEVRGRALNQYLRTLDQIGVRGELSLAWVARLPL